MALFTNKDDRDIPLATQFYQLEFDSENPVGSELEVWVERIIFGQGNWRSGEAGELIPPGTIHETLSTRIDAADLVRLAELHGLVRRLMDATADEILPDWIDRDAFNRWRNEVRLRETLVQWQASPREPGQILVWTNPRASATVSSVIDEIAHPILEEVTISVLAGANPSRYPKATFRGVARCWECNSPYLVRAKGTKFCSTRCRHRQGQRGRFRNLYAK